MTYKIIIALLLVMAFSGCSRKFDEIYVGRYVDINHKGGNIYLFNGKKGTCAVTEPNSRTLAATCEITGDTLKVTINPSYIAGNVAEQFYYTEFLDGIEYLKVDGETLISADKKRFVRERR